MLFDANGWFTYIPDADYNGTDRFIYRLCDAVGENCIKPNECDCSVIIDSIYIAPVKDYPKAEPDRDSIFMNQVFNGDVSLNDHRTGDGKLTWFGPASRSDGPFHGVLSFKPDGKFTYTPVPGYKGTDEFNYNLCDEDNDCDPSRVTITIVTPPVAVNDTFNTSINTVLTSNVANNDQAGGMDHNRWRLMTYPAVGTVTFTSKGDFTYAPYNGFKGIISFTYSLCDSLRTNRACSTATVYINVRTFLQPPVLSTIHPTCTVSTGAIAVTSPSGSGYSYSIDGKNYQISGLFTNLSPGIYTITVKNTEGITSSSKDTINTIPVPPEQPTTKWEDPTCSVPGKITVLLPIGFGYKYSENGINFQDSPVLTKLGAGTYTVTVMNGSTCTSSILVTLKTPPESPPEPVISIRYPTCEIPYNSAVVSPTSSEFLYSLDNSGFTSYPADGYKPIASGRHTISVKNTKGCTIVVNFTVESRPVPKIPDPPVFTVINPTCDVPAGTIKINDDPSGLHWYSIDGGLFVNNPATGFTGLKPDTLHTLTVKNEQNCTTSVKVLIPKIPDGPPAPVIKPMLLTCRNNTGTIEVVSDTTGMKFSFDGAGFTAYPRGGYPYLLPESRHTLVVMDRLGCRTRLTVTIPKLPDPPAAPEVSLLKPSCKDTIGTIIIPNPDSKLTYSLDGGIYTPYPPGGYPGVKIGSHTIRVKNSDECTNKKDVDLKALLDTIRPVAMCKQNLTLILGINNQLIINAKDLDNGSYDNCGISSYLSNKTYFTCADTGRNVLRLKVTDPSGNSDSCTAIITILGNKPPVAVGDFEKVYYGMIANIPLLANDSDPNSKIDSTKLSISSMPLHGKATINTPSGILTYVPDSGFSGTDKLIYRICDDGRQCGVLCDTAVVTIVVLPENIKPVAVNDFYEAGCLPITGNILRNDYDRDSNKIILNTKPIKPPKYGEFNLMADGNFIYTTKTKYAYKDSLLYKICDDGYPPKCDTAIVYINTFLDEDCNGIPDILKYEFFIPEGFSPNDDKVHDYFEILGIEKYPDAKLLIFNRWGSLIFKKEHYGNLIYWGSPKDAWWDGRSHHGLTIGYGNVPAGNYVYILDLNNGKAYKGTVMVSY